MYSEKTKFARLIFECENGLYDREKERRCWQLLTLKECSDRFFFAYAALSNWILLSLGRANEYQQMHTWNFINIQQTDLNTIAIQISFHLVYILQSSENWVSTG